MEPSSASEPIPEHVTVPPTATPLEGDTDTELMVGTVLSTVTLELDVAVEPAESVAVAVQVTEEPTSVSAAVTV